MSPELDQKERDLRAAKHRARVMLTATLLSRDVVAEVRIRNISETGALLEGETMPTVGNAFLLQRGSHEIGGEVMWVKGTRCGVRFAEPIVTADWAGVQTSVAPKSFVKAEPQPRPACDTDSLETLLPRRVAEELAYVQRLIETMGNELANNPLVVARHGRTFQNADLAVQILGHLGRVLSAEDRGAAAARIGMTELRARLLR